MAHALPPGVRGQGVEGLRQPGLEKAQQHFTCCSQAQVWALPWKSLWDGKVMDSGVWPLYPLNLKPSSSACIS